MTSGYRYIKSKGRIVGDVWGHAGSVPLRMDHYRNVDNTMRNYHDIIAQWRAWDFTPDKQVRFTAARDGAPERPSSMPL